MYYAKTFIAEKRSLRNSANHFNYKFKKENHSPETKNEKVRCISLSDFSLVVKAKIDFFTYQQSILTLNMCEALGERRSSLTLS